MNKLFHENDVKVVDREDSLILRIGRGSEIQSYYSKEDVFIRPLLDHYWNFFSVFPFIKDINRVLIIGLGAGTISRQLLHLFPNMIIDGVELNKTVIKAAKEFFNLEHDNLNIHEMSGEEFLSQSKEKYDLVILDAFDGPNVSNSVLNSKFFNLIKEHLNEDSLFVINYIDEGLIRDKVRKQMLMNFETVHSIQIKGSLNFLMLGSAKDLCFVSVPENKDLQKIKNYMQKEVIHVKSPTASCQLQSL